MSSNRDNLKEELMEIFDWNEISIMKEFNFPNEKSNDETKTLITSQRKTIENANKMNADLIKTVFFF